MRGSMEGWVTRRLPQIYLVVALLVSGALCLLTPPFDVPDESNHASREIQIEGGQLMAERSPGGGGGALDKGFEAAANGMDRIRGEFLTRYEKVRHAPDGRVTEAQMAPLEGIGWARRREFRVFANTAVYPPGLYLPQVLGWWLGEAEDLTIFHSLRLARMIATLFAVGLGWMTLQLAAEARWPLFGYLLLPTVLNLGASCSQDAILLPAMAFVVVVVLRAVSAGRVLRLGEIAGLVLLLTLCVGARVTYLPLALMLMVPALELRGGWKTWVRPAAGIAMVAGLVGAWQTAVRPMGMLLAAGADPAGQMAFLRAHPASGLLSLLDAAFHLMPTLMVKGLYLLGSEDAGPSHALYAVMALGLVGIWMLSPVNGVKTAAAKALLGVGIVGMVVGTSLAEYLVWTPPGAPHVEGLQARYFLPLLPFCLLLGWPGLRRVHGAVRGVAMTMFLGGVVCVPWVAARVFYLEGLGAALRLGLR